jgi:hypothetical protein
LLPAELTEIAVDIDVLLFFMDKGLYLSVILLRYGYFPTQVKVKRRGDDKKYVAKVSQLFQCCSSRDFIKYVFNVHCSSF